MYSNNLHSEILSCSSNDVSLSKTNLSGSSSNVINLSSTNTTVAVPISDASSTTNISTSSNRGFKISQARTSRDDTRSHHTVCTQSAESHSDASQDRNSGKFTATPTKSTQPPMTRSYSGHRSVTAACTLTSTQISTHISAVRPISTTCHSSSGVSSQRSFQTDVANSEAASKSMHTEETSSSCARGTASTKYSDSALQEANTLLPRSKYKHNKFKMTVRENNISHFVPNETLHFGNSSQKAASTNQEQLEAGSSPGNAYYHQPIRESCETVDICDAQVDASVCSAPPVTAVSNAALRHTPHSSERVYMSHISSSHGSRPYRRGIVSAANSISPGHSQHEVLYAQQLHSVKSNYKNGNHGNSHQLQHHSSFLPYQTLTRDSKGVNVETFLTHTLCTSQKDQALLFSFEDEIINLINDDTRFDYLFPPQTSYQRMLIHRAAVYYGLDHNVCQLGSQVMVNKTDHTRIPPYSFRDLVAVNCGINIGEMKNKPIQINGINELNNQPNSSIISTTNRDSQNFVTTCNQSRSCQQYVSINSSIGSYDNNSSVVITTVTITQSTSIVTSCVLDQSVSSNETICMPAVLSEVSSSMTNATQSVAQMSLHSVHSDETHLNYSTISTNVQIVDTCSRTNLTDSTASCLSRLSLSSGYKSVSTEQTTLDSTPSPANISVQSAEDAAMHAASVDSESQTAGACNHSSGAPAGHHTSSSYNTQPPAASRIHYVPEYTPVALSHHSLPHQPPQYACHQFVPHNSVRLHPNISADLHPYYTDMTAQQHYQQSQLCALQAYNTNTQPSTQRSYHTADTYSQMPCVSLDDCAHAYPLNYANQEPHNLSGHAHQDNVAYLSANNYPQQPDLCHQFPPNPPYYYATCFPPIYYASAYPPPSGMYNSVTRYIASNEPINSQVTLQPNSNSPAFGFVPLAAMRCPLPFNQQPVSAQQMLSLAPPLAVNTENITGDVPHHHQPASPLVSQPPLDCGSGDLESGLAPHSSQLSTPCSAASNEVTSAVYETPQSLTAQTHAVCHQLAPPLVHTTPVGCVSNGGARPVLHYHPQMVPYPACSVTAAATGVPLVPKHVPFNALRFVAPFRPHMFPFNAANGLYALGVPPLANGNAIRAYNYGYGMSSFGLGSGRHRRSNKYRVNGGNAPSRNAVFPTTSTVSSSVVSTGANAGLSSHFVAMTTTSVSMAKVVSSSQQTSDDLHVNSIEFSDTHANFFVFDIIGCVVGWTQDDLEVRLASVLDVSRLSPASCVADVHIMCHPDWPQAVDGVSCFREEHSVSLIVTTNDRSMSGEQLQTLLNQQLSMTDDNSSTCHMSNQTTNSSSADGVSSTVLRVKVRSV